MCVLYISPLGSDIIIDCLLCPNVQIVGNTIRLVLPEPVLPITSTCPRYLATHMALWLLQARRLYHSLEFYLL